MQTISLVETMPNLSIFQEAAEETGLDDLVVRSHLGSQDYDLSPFGMDETQRWHFYHLGFLGNLPERWRHFERQLADGSPSPI